MTREIPFFSETCGAEELASNLFGQKVRVYWNLHKNLFSVMYYQKSDVRDQTTGKLSRKGWKVHHHTKLVYLKDTKLFVSEAGRARCLRLNRKTVHAYVEGILSHGETWVRESFDIPKNGGHKEEISYNPKKGPSFFSREDKRWVSTAKMVRFGVWLDSNSQPTIPMLWAINAD